MRSRGYRVSDEGADDIHDILARYGGMRFLDDGVGFADEYKRNAGPAGTSPASPLPSATI